MFCCFVFSGVRASENMAATDKRNVDNYKTMIKSAASSLCVDPAVIAGNFCDLRLFETEYLRI